jgi:chromate transport protein ChrA
MKNNRKTIIGIIGVLYIILMPILILSMSVLILLLFVDDILYSVKFAIAILIIIIILVIYAIYVIIKAFENRDRDD